MPGNAGGSRAGTSTMGMAGECACPDIDCRAGYEAKPNPNGCCSVCVPSTDPCADGSCEMACAEAKAKYQELRQQVLMKYQAPACGMPSGCFLFQEDNRCAVTCGTPIPRTMRDFAEEDLYNFAFENCGVCPELPRPDCPPNPPAVCLDDVCQFADADAGAGP